MINVLVACEESQTVTKEFRKLGVNAYSCDLLPCSGGHPEWHFNSDIFEVIQKKQRTLQNGDIFIMEGDWDIMIAHPPCTYLSSSGAAWYYHPEDKHLPINERRPHPRYPNRQADKQDAIDFFMKLANTDIPRIAIENPIGVMSTHYRKPDQIVHPWMFGDSASKSTCLWLKNLPLLVPTNIVDKGERVIYKSGKSHAKWYHDALANAKSPEERRTLRSKTFVGIAEAMATQWLRHVLNERN